MLSQEEELTTIERVTKETLRDGLATERVAEEAMDC